MVKTDVLTQEPGKTNEEDSGPLAFFLAFFVLFFLQKSLFSDRISNSRHLDENSDYLMEDITELEEKRVELEREHRDLDEIIERLRSTPPVDFFFFFLLQKKKLFLKDQISKIKSDILPDIIA